MLVPFLFLFVFLSIGIVLNHFFNLYIPFYIPIGILLISLFIKHINSFFLLILGVFLLGCSLIYEKPIEKLPDIPVFVSCKISSIPKVYFYGKSFSCLITSSDFSDIKGKDIKVFIKETHLSSEIFYLSNLSFIGYLKNTEGKIVSYPSKNFIKIDNSYNPFIYIFRLKNFLMKNYEEKSLNEETFQIGLPLIFGEKGFISSETREIFGKTGLSHLLAISGLHVGILIVSILFVLFFLKNETKQLIVLLILPFYALFTGMQVPVLRASIMGGLYFFTKLKHLKVNSLNILFFVEFVILLFSPKQIFNVGFQLSFLATLGIILGLDLINFSIKNIPKILNFLIQMFIVSFIATIFTLPLILYYFGGFSIISIFATPFAVLPLYPYLFLSVINLITFMKLGFLVKLMDFFGILFLKMVDFFYGFDGYFQGFSPSIFIIFIYIAFISFILLLNLNIYKKLAVVLVSTFVFLTVSKTKHDSFKIYTFKSKNLPAVLIFTPDRDGYLIGDYADFRLKRIIRNENPLRMYLIYSKNKPYKIINNLNIDFDNYFRFYKNFKVRNLFKIRKERNFYILTIKDKNLVLKNENNVFNLQH